tara:strand:+ start:351 stop:527 length:177 start_codon:yes stop_codon:yes gene_type:complete
MFNLAFENFNEFLDMDGHGVYVWSVYLIGASLIFLSFFIAKKRINDIRKKIKIKNASG